MSSFGVQTVTAFRFLINLKLVDRLRLILLMMVMLIIILTSSFLAIQSQPHTHSLTLARIRTITSVLNLFGRLVNRSVTDMSVQHGTCDVCSVHVNEYLSVRDV